MALYRDKPIHYLVDQLDLVLPGNDEPMARVPVVEARGRLGAEPLKWLFERTARLWAHESGRRHAWRDLALYGVDGSTFREDSSRNRAHFGVPKGPRGDSGYPLVRTATLMALRSHLMASVEFGSYADSEVVLARSLWKEVPDDALMVVDPRFLAAAIRLPLNRDG
jgi:Insertion element 4 transposase N-terminal